jgi:small subunit ribosomal protein S27Ae
MPRKGGATGERKGKKPHKNKPTSKKYKYYKIAGNNIKREKSCPRCGPGIFLANHKNRLHCGKCNYTEFVTK